MPWAAVGRGWRWLQLTRAPATASCECGYTVNQTTAAQFQLYTDLLENDFLHTANLTQSGWQPQEYTISAEAARGPYGKAFSPSNIVPNPLRDVHSWAGDAAHGGDAGLQMIVRSDKATGAIGSAEMATFRTDMLHGSYRVAMKMSGQPGTCGSMFWVRLALSAAPLLRGRAR